MLNMVMGFKVLCVLALPLLLLPCHLFARSVFPDPSRSDCSSPCQLLKYQTIHEAFSLLFPQAYGQFFSRFTFCEAACHRAGSLEIDSKVQTIEMQPIEMQNVH